MNENKNNQTTSTKCQYQIANSNPKWCLYTSSLLRVRTKHHVRNNVPIITCRPWKPVATKKVAPNTLSLIVNTQVLYSNNWNPVKIIPNKIVSPNETNTLLLNWILWWAKVTEAPDDNRIQVFNKGTEKGSKGWVAKGGHTSPMSKVGETLLWKNAQKKAIKNRASLKINISIPIFNPSCTFLEWSPNITASRPTSRHHSLEHNRRHNNP